MISITPTRVLIALVAMIAMQAVAFTAGWNIRGTKAERDAAQFRLDLDAAAAKQRTDKFVIESQQEAITAKSTQRLDDQQAEQQKETVYVEKQVIQYRDRWRDRVCKHPDDWVRLYNESLFGNGAAVPKAP